MDRVTLRAPVHGVGHKSRTRLSDFHYYLGVKLNVAGSFVLLPVTFSMAGTKQTIFLYISVERRQKAVATLHIKAPIQAKGSMLTEELRARHHRSIYVQMLLPLNSSRFLSLDSSSAASPWTPAATLTYFEGDTPNRLGGDNNSSGERKAVSHARLSCE